MKINGISNISLCILFSITLVSCTQLSLEDVSSDPDYSFVIGKIFRTKVDLLAIGVTADQNYAKQVDYVVLVAEPGFTGPEVVSKAKLDKGAVIRVEKVLKTKSIFVSRIIYVVDITSSEEYKGAEVRVKMTGRSDDKNFGLTNLVYERLELQQ